MPNLIMHVVWQRSAEIAGQPNRFYHAPVTDHTFRLFVLPNPGVLYSICPYNVSENPVVIRSTIPGSYWSLALYDMETNNFRTFSTADLPRGQFELKIVGLNSTADRAGSSVVVSPTDKGIALVRVGVSRIGTQHAGSIQKAGSCQTSL